MSKLSRANLLVPYYRELKEKVKPKNYKKDNGSINFSNLGMASGVNRQEIVKLVNIKTREDIKRILRLIERYHIDHKNLVRYYLCQDHTKFFITDITEYALMLEIKNCKKYNIKLLHANYKTLSDVKMKYGNITKYTRFSYIRNNIVIDELEKKRTLFKQFQINFDVIKFINSCLSKYLRLTRYIQEYSDLIILFLFRSWSRYKDLERIYGLVEQLQDEFNRKNNAPLPELRYMPWVIARTWNARQVNKYF